MSINFAKYYRNVNNTRAIMDPPDFLDCLSRTEVLNFKYHTVSTLHTSKCVSYCMVSASVREKNPQALARGLLPMQTQHHTIACLLNQHALRDI